MLIYGWKRYVQVLAVLTLVCQQCAIPAEHVLRRLTTKVTLFFVPLFPISRKHTLTCTACEATNKLSREQAEQLVASGQQAPAAQQPPHHSAPPPPPPQPAYGAPQQPAGPPPMQHQQPMPG